MSAQIAAAASMERAPTKRKSLGPKPGSRAALHDVTGLHLNDDESEKARLRADKEKGDQPLSLSLSASTSSLGAKRKSLPPLMRQNSLIAANLLRKPLSTEEWRETMKLANTGKFNTKNMGVVWGNNLISDMYNLLLGPDAKKAIQQAGAGRSAKALFESDMDSLDSGEQSNQFQKASCTLDASMMIYSSRVDDVHKNTFKVLGGLSNGAVSAVVDDDDDDEASEAPALGEDGAPLPVAEKKKKSRRVLGGVGASATLEPNASKLDTRLLETDVAPDPLFHLTTAKFEGGAGGMLMNNLSVYSGAKICLDSSEEFVLLNKPAPTTSAERDEMANQTQRAEQALRANMDFSNLAALVAEGLAAAGGRAMEELVLTSRVDQLLEQKAVLLGKKVEPAAAPVVAATGKKGKAAAAAAAAAAALAASAADPIDFDFAAISLPEPEPAAMAESAVPMTDDNGSEMMIAETPSIAASAPLEVLSTQMSQVMEALEAEAALNAEMQSYSAEAGAGYGEGDADDDDDGARSVATLTSASGASAASGSASTGTGLRTIEEDVATMEPAWGVLDGLADLKTNWAGVSHWKFKAKAGAAAGAAGAKKAKKPRAAKGAKDLLDFSGVLLSATGPVAAVSKSSLRLADTLTNAWERTARETALRLPDDRFYRVRNLQTLCQKPGVLVKLRAPGSAKRRVIVAASSAIAAGSRRQSSAEMGLEAMEDAGGFVPATPASSSAQHAASVEFVEPTPSAHSAVLGDMAGLVHGVGNSPLGALGAGAVDEPAMAQLQFDNAADDDDDGHENEMASSYGGAGGDYDEEYRGDGMDAAGSSLIAPPARAERLEIGYARVSKKVDVKALKAAMWAGIDQKDGGARSFAASINQVHRLARGELQTQLPDITPSYYFISLLHLCNEHGLALEDTPERQKQFGDFKIIMPQ